ACRACRSAAGNILRRERRSGASHATDGKAHRRAESRPAHGAGRRCAHDPKMRFPAPSTPFAEQDVSRRGMRRDGGVFISIIYDLVIDEVRLKYAKLNTYFVLRTSPNRR